MNLDLFQNPWSSGGNMNALSPNTTGGMNYAWEVGNAFFQPKSKKQLEQEALLQLAVLLLVVAAPAIAGAAAGSGGAAGTSAASTTAGAATGAEAAGAAAGQASLATSATAGSAAAGGASGLLAATGVTSALALQPYLQPQAQAGLSQAAAGGLSSLNAYFHQVAPPSSGFVFDSGGFQTPQSSYLDTQAMPPSTQFILQFMDEVGPRGIRQMARNHRNRNLNHPFVPTISPFDHQILNTSIPILNGLNSNIWESGVPGSFISNLPEMPEPSLILPSLFNTRPASAYPIPPTYLTQLSNQSGDVKLPKDLSLELPLNLDNATFDEVYERLQQVLFQVNTRNPFIAGGTGVPGGINTGEWVFGNYFSGRLLSNIGGGTYSFTGQTPLGQITIQLVNIAPTDRINSTFAMSSNTVRTTLPNGTTQIISSAEGPIISNNTNLGSNIIVQTQQLPFDPQIPVNGIQAFSKEALTLLNKFGTQENAAIAIFEKKFTYEAMLFRGPPYIARQRIPLTSRNDFGTQYLSQSERNTLHQYSGQPIWPFTIQK